jgi:hypothetical protein
MIMHKIGPQELQVTLTEEEAFEIPTPRRTFCPRYEDCLEYAASRFWVSFTCKGCCMEEPTLVGGAKGSAAADAKEVAFWKAKDQGR